MMCRIYKSFFGGGGRERGGKRKREASDAIGAFSEAPGTRDSRGIAQKRGYDGLFVVSDQQGKARSVTGIAAWVSCD